MSEVRQRIVVDLDDTLTQKATNQLRPGARRLLKELNERGEVILWTSARRPRLEDFLAAHPDLAVTFVSTVYSTDFLDEYGTARIPDSFAWTPELLDRATSILNGYEGGKIPPLVGAKVVIDDTAHWMQRAGEAFGFRAIDAASKFKDSDPEAWVNRILQALHGIT